MIVEVYSVREPVDDYIGRTGEKAYFVPCDACGLEFKTTRDDVWIWVDLFDEKRSGDPCFICGDCYLKLLADPVAFIRAHWPDVLSDRLFNPQLIIRSEDPDTGKIPELVEVG